MPADLTALARMKNVGRKTAGWLVDVGIETPEDVHRLGAVAVYKRLKASRPDVTLLALYALQGAILDLHWNALPEDMKADLRAEAEAG